jgi:flagellar basal body-associated protein FliL
VNPDIDRQEMRNYLLGALDEDRRTQFEERILSEPGVYEELLVAEDELIEQSVAGDLSEIEQKQFETHFLITAERQKNLRFGELLQRYVNSHIALVEPKKFVKPAQHEPLDHSFSLLRTPNSRWSTLVFLAVILACAGVILVAWFGSKREAEGGVQQTIPGVVIVTLAPGSAGPKASTSQRVTEPPKGVAVKLELELTNATFRNYKSELFRENRSLQVSDELRIEAKGEQRVVPFTVTGEMLSPGDYKVKLSGVLDSGANEFIDNYSFRVTSK